jgi:hypothetical protein
MPEPNNSPGRSAANGEDERAASAAPAQDIAEEAGLADLVWRWLNSLSVAIWVLVFVAILSIIGTVVPQWNQADGASNAAYIARYGDLKWAIIRFFGFHRVYSVWYFVLLNIWLAVSAAACTTKKLREAINAVKRPPVDKSDRFYRAGKAFQNSVAADAQKAEELLHHAHFSVVRQESPDGSVRLLGQRGTLRLWALVAMHFSILVVLLGVAVSYMYGANGMVTVDPFKPTRVTVNPVENKPGWLKSFLQTHVKPQVFEFKLNGFHIPMDVLKYTESSMETGHKDVDEFMRLVVRQYTSDLTVKAGDAEQRKENLSVNWPMRVEGLTIYQSAYRYILPLRFELDSKELPSTPVISGSTLAVSRSGVGDYYGQPAPYIVEVLDFKVGEVYEGNTLIRELPPTALVRVTSMSGDSSLHMVSPDEPATVSSLELKMGGKEEVQAISIFSYKLDRGIDIVYLGTILLTLGSLFALWIGFDRVYVRAKDGRSDWRLVRQGLQLRLDETLGRIISGRAAGSAKNWDGAD